MKTILVCVGSSCYLMGAYDVINKLKELINEHGLNDEIELKACFCLGRCQDGVSLSLNGRIFTSLTKDNTEEFFNKRILEEA